MSYKTNVFSDEIVCEMVNEIARVITDIVVEHVTEPRTKLFRVVGRLDPI